MATQKNTETSIIEIIQNMVRQGESEAAILKTLKELGVDPEQAKKLLLLGEADTFALLRGDIVKIVRENVQKEKTDLKNFINQEVKNQTSGSEQKVLKTVITDLQQYEKDIENQSKNFQEDMNENINRVSFLSERVKEKLNDLGSAVRQVQVDMDELKVRGIASRNKYISWMLIMLGIAFALIDLYLLMTTFNATVTSVDSLIILIIIGMISVTMLFVSTLI